MNECSHVEELLFESLYGLLEPAEEEELRLHLEQCTGCQAALTEARQQRQLLARAAQVCPQVAPFSLPGEPAVAARQETAVVSMAERAPVRAAVRPRRFRKLAYLAAAAAVVLAAGGLWNHYRLTLADYEHDLNAARKQVQETDARLAQAQTDFRQDRERLPAAVEKEFVHVQVLGPARLCADTPAPVRVATRDLAGQPVPTRLTARLVAGGKELHRQELASSGDRSLILPAGMFEKAGDAQLLVEARTEDAVARVEEAIRLETPAHVAHLSLNKSVYQVGEVVFFRALALESFSLKPPAEPLALQFSLVDPAGKPTMQLAIATGAGGIAAGELALTQELVSGTYALEVKGPGMATQHRPLEVLRDVPPQLQFDRSEYRPGETMTANFKGRRGPGGQAIPNQDLKVKVLVDGKEVKVESVAPALAAPGNVAPPPAALGGAAALRTDARGNAAIRATLPTNIETGKALVEIQARNGKQQDKLVQSIPVVGSRLSVEFFPEGGNLVAGVPNRVYYRVRTPLGEPVDPEGYVIILSKKDVVLASERNQGLGVFTFTPDARDKYTLRVTSARGITETADPFQKLGILDRSIALHVPDGVSQEGKPLRLILRNTGPSQRLLAVATCRGRIVAQDVIEAGKETSEMQLHPVAGTRGVVRVTIYEAGGAALVPVAERLVYRAPNEKLTITAQGDKKSYRPGERVTLQLRTGVPAWLLATVVDERVSLDRSAASPEASFYLISAVRQRQDLENADLLLADSNRAQHELDLFLGTQGWRRFVPVEPAVLARDNAAASEPLLFSRENASPAALQTEVTQAVQKELARLRQVHVQKLAALAEERSSQSERAALAVRQLTDFQSRPAELLRLSLGIVIVALLLAGALALAIGFIRILRRSVSPTGAFATACGCLLACLLLYAASGSVPGTVAPRGTLPADLADRRRWLLEPEDQPGRVQTAQGARSPQGLFALAPAREDNRFGMPQLHEQRVLRSEAKNSVAKDGDHDRHRDGTFMLQPSAGMQQRFAEAEKAREKSEGAGLTSGKKTAAPDAKSKGGAGTNPAHVRAYAHRNDPKAAAAGTLLWHPALFAADGQAQASFDLPATPATYRILLYGHDSNGRLGWHTQKLQIAD